MASLPKLFSDSRSAPVEVEMTVQRFGSVILPQNTRKIRHIKSIELIHQITTTKNSISADDTLIKPKQRLKKLQSKSTYNLRDSELDSRRIASSSTTGLLIGKDEIDQSQLNLQQLYIGKYYTSFYTLNNFMNVDKPFFISRTFDPFSNIEDPIDINMNNKSFTVNVYFKLTDDSWVLYRQYHIKLSLLICIGDDLSIIKESTLVSNMIIFKLSDDCYYSLPNDELSTDDLKAIQTNYLNKASEILSNVKIREKTSTYDQTMKLNNYSRCIYDLMITKEELETRIKSSLNTKQNNKRQYDQCLMSIKGSKFETDELFTQFEKKKILNHELTVKLRNLKDMQLERTQAITRSESYFDFDKIQRIKDETAKYDTGAQKVLSGINVEKAKIANTLIFVFPIEEVKSNSGKLDFQLFDVKLPNALSLSYPVFKSIFANGASGATKFELIQRLSQLSTLNIEKLNSVVGCMALIISTFANIMNIQLRYPIRFLGSHSYIHNPISNIKSAVRDTRLPIEHQKELSQTSNSNPKGEVYPLFAGHNVSLSVRFVYSLILLKKDLAQLFAIDQLAKIEGFNLLASLKIFLTCISSYEVEVEGIEDEHLDDGGNGGAVWVSTDSSDSAKINHIRKVSTSSTFTKTSKNVEVFNEQIHSEERFNVIKNQLRQYAK